MSRLNLSELGLRHPTLTAYFIGLLLLVGGVSYSHLGQTDMPTWTLRTMLVRVAWPGASARQIEQQVVAKIERKLQDTPYLDNIASSSLPGEAWIWVNLANSITRPSKVVPPIWYQVRKKVGDIRHTLPAGVQGPFFNDEFGDVFPLVYAMWGEDFDYRQLKDRADWLRDALLRLDLVAKVVLTGAQPQRVFVEFDATRLANLGITPSALVTALQGTNAIQPAGAMERTDSRIRLRLSGEFRTAADVGQVMVRSTSGRLLRLADIATVRPAYQDPPLMRMRINGHPAVGLAIAMADGGNVLDMRRAVVAEAARLAPGLPHGMHLTLAADEPRVVAHSQRQFLGKLAMAVLIVLVISFFTLGLRAGVVVSLAFPLVLGATFAMMRLLDVNLQRVSLGALIISLGLLVDDAIIIVEMTLVKLRQGMDRFQAAGAAYRSTSFPMLAGTLVTAAGFMPIAIAKTATREFLFGLYGVVAIALIVSWLVSVLFTPYLGYRLLSPGAGHHEQVYATLFYRRLRSLIEWCVGHRWLLIAITLLLGALAVMAGTRVQKQFFPLTDRADLIVETWLPESSSFTANITVARRIDELLARESGIERYVSYVGYDTPRIFTDLWLEPPAHNVVKTYVLTRDRATRNRLRERLRRRLAQELPEVRSRVNYFSFGLPVPASLEYRISGPDRTLLRQYAARVEEAVASYPGATGINYDWRGPVTTVRAELDQARIATLGLSARDIGRQLDLLLSGLPVTELRDDDETIPVVLRLRDPQRKAPADLAGLPIQLPGGGQVPLAQLARLRYDVEEGVIRHYNRVPTITVRADIPAEVQPLDVDALLAPKLDQVRAELPLGYHLEVGGTGELNAEVDAAIGGAMPVIFLVIITILMIQLQNFGAVLLVVATAPLGIIGVLFTLYAVDLPLGLVARLGILALAGITMRNTVILVDQIRQDLEAGLTRHQAVVEATVRRFRPIVVTAVAAALALIPLLSDPFWGPMAYALIGGLVVATVLTILFVPALYAAAWRVSKP